MVAKQEFVRAKTKQPGTPVFVLDQPQMGENIGMAMRAMANFGLRALRVVAPRDGWPNEKALRAAKHARPLLEEARLFRRLDEALADCDVVYACTARPRFVSVPVCDPQRAVRSMLRRPCLRAAVLFGNEADGLANTALQQAHRVVSMPVDPLFPSMNLAQAVAVFSYAWAQQTRGKEEAAGQKDMPPPASMATMQVLIDRMVGLLHSGGGFFGGEKEEQLLRRKLGVWLRFRHTTDGQVGFIHKLLSSAQAAPRSGRAFTAENATKGRIGSGEETCSCHDGHNGECASNKGAQR